METYYNVTIKAEGEGKLGHEVKKASFIVRATSEAIAVNQVTSWVVSVFANEGQIERGPQLLRHLDIKAHYMEGALKPEIFDELGLERFNPFDWLTYLPDEPVPVQQPPPPPPPPSSTPAPQPCVECGGAPDSPCCNGDCQGHWGTGCYHCHYFKFHPDYVEEEPTTDLPRTPDGDINNCAIAFGVDEGTCQMCDGVCPDRERFGR